MEQNLCEAAIDGDVNSLMEIVQQDRLVLKRVVAGFSTINPLHVAATYGQDIFVERLLEMCEGLTGVLDAQHRTALHLASAGGHLEVVKALISKRPDMCLVCDKDGRNPIHIAAIEGRAEVIEILFKERPHAVRNKVSGGDTILHLCVNYHQMESFKLLLQLVKGSEFVNAQDGSGNTVLHLAVSDKHLQMVQHMLDRKNHFEIDINARNALGQTALDILSITETEDSETNKSIGNHLLGAGSATGNTIVHRDWLNSSRDAILVVASLMATIAFQAAVTPPGGVWQENTADHRAGEAVMASRNPGSYPFFMRANTIGFVTALCTILFLMSRLPLTENVYAWCVMLIIWINVLSMSVAFAVSLTVVTPEKLRGTVTNSFRVGIIVLFSTVAVLMVVHSVRLIKIWVVKERSKKMAIKSIRDTETMGSDSVNSTGGSVSGFDGLFVFMALNVFFFLFFPFSLLCKQLISAHLYHLYLTVVLSITLAYFEETHLLIQVKYPLIIFSVRDDNITELIIDLCGSTRILRVENGTRLVTQPTSKPLSLAQLSLLK